MEYYGNFGHTLVYIHKIDLMRTIDICYISCLLGTQTVVPTIPGFQGLKRFIQYLASYPNNPLFILLIISMDQMLSYLNGVFIKFKTTQPRIV